MLKVNSKSVRFLVLATSVIAYAWHKYETPSSQRLVPISNVSSVYDGDTFRLGDERIRILGMDAPEIGTRSKCASEGRTAIEARNYLRETLSRGNIRIARDGEDIYGRTLAHVYVDGIDVAQDMIEKGLAVTYSPAAHGSWCKMHGK